MGSGSGTPQADTFLSTANKDLALGVAASSRVDFDLEITTPSTVTKVEQMNVPVTIVAAASE